MYCKTIEAIAMVRVIMCSVAVFGWVQNITADRSSAVLQESIDAVEGEEISLTVYFTKNGPHFMGLMFDIETGGSATGICILYTVHILAYKKCVYVPNYVLSFFCFMNLEGVDYVLPQSNFTLSNIPFSITITLLNNEVVGEEPETITLTLMPDRDLEANEILSNPAITITLHDNESM